MATVGTVTTRLEAEHSKFTAGTKAAKGDIDNFAEHVHGKLEDLKKAFGRGSLLEETMKMARGAGVVMGLNEAAKSVEEIGHKASELSEKFQKGQTDAAGIALGIGESLPIAGHVVRAVEEITEAFTGTKAAEKELQEQFKSEAEALKTIRDFEKQAEESTRETAVQIQEIQAKLDGLSLPEMFQKVNELRVQIVMEEGNAKNKLDKEIEGAKEKFTEAARHNGAMREYFAGQHKHKNIDAMSGDEIMATFKEDLDSYHVKQAQGITNQGTRGKAIMTALREGVDDLYHVRNARDEDVKTLTENYEKKTAKAKEFNDAQTKATARKALPKYMDEYNPMHLALGDFADRKVLEESAKKKTDAIRGILDDIAAKEADAKAKLSKNPEESSNIAKLKKEGASSDQIAAAEAQMKHTAEIEKQTKAQHDAAEQVKKDQEEAKRLAEEAATPLEKHADQVRELERLWQQNLLTFHQYHEALKKADKDAMDAHKKEEKTKYAKAENRRFDFYVPPSNEKDDSKTFQAQLDQQTAAANSLRKLEDVMSGKAPIWNLISGGI